MLPHGQQLNSAKPPIHIIMPFYKLPSLPDVHKASALIERKIKKTPVGTSLHLSHIASSNTRRSRGNPTSQSSIELFFKLENLQSTGSFKFRGASHFLAKLEDHELSNGVVTYSTGKGLL
jgi:threonine dehydratase